MVAYHFFLGGGGCVGFFFGIECFSFQVWRLGLEDSLFQTIWLHFEGFNFRVFSRFFVLVCVGGGSCWVWRLGCILQGWDVCGWYFYVAVWHNISLFEGLSWKYGRTCYLCLVYIMKNHHLFAKMVHLFLEPF